MPQYRLAHQVLIHGDGTVVGGAVARMICAQLVLAAVEIHRDHVPRGPGVDEAVERLGPRPGFRSTLG